LHGPALPQHLYRRPCLSFAARMGEPAGHGKGGGDHCRTGEGLGGTGLRRRPASKGEDRGYRSYFRPASSDRSGKGSDFESCHGHFPSISTSSERLRKVLISTIPASTARLSRPGSIATV